MTEMQVNARGVLEMVKSSETSQDEIKKTVHEIQRTIQRLGNELSRLAGHLEHKEK